MSERIEWAAGGEAETVAVIIPVYNGEKFIARSLDSVMKQTLAPAEILVVDDGSSDGTLEILRRDYPGVKVISQAKGGPARARNVAMRAAKSELFGFLDADDWWEPEKLERQVASLRAHPEAVMNYTSLRTVRESDGAVGYTIRDANEETWPQLRWHNPGICPACVMVRRTAVEQVGGFDERQRGSEDWNFWFKLRQLGPFCVCTEPLTNYRVSPTGLSGNAEHMFNDFLQMLDDVLLSGLTGLERAVLRRKIIAFQAFRGAMTARGAGDAATEARYMRISMLAWPSPFWAPERYKAMVVGLLRR